MSRQVTARRSRSSEQAQDPRLSWWTRRVASARSARCGRSPHTSPHNSQCSATTAAAGAGAQIRCHTPSSARSTISSRSSPPPVGSAFVYGFSSGAILTLLAAARGLAIPKIALLEPPLQVNGEPRPSTDMGAQVAKLVVLGRREEALEHWMKGIGVPTDIITAMRGDPSWPARAAVAHTLVYDSLIPGSLPADQLSAIATPTLVVASDASGDQMQSWSRGLAEALPNGSLRILKGQRHGVPPEDLAPVLAEFFIGLLR
jgi:pimeloyl-ACP methyl ester carboxylesterase